MLSLPGDQSRNSLKLTVITAIPEEPAYILAYLAHGCNTGAVGTEQGFLKWGNGTHTSYPLDWKSLLSVAGGGYQLYYRGPLSELNIIRISENGQPDDLTKTVGFNLAERAFGYSILKGCRTRNLF